MPGLAVACEPPNDLPALGTRTGVAAAIECTIATPNSPDTVPPILFALAFSNAADMPTSSVTNQVQCDGTTDPGGVQWFFPSDSNETSPVGFFGCFLLNQQIPELYWTYSSAQIEVFAGGGGLTSAQLDTWFFDLEDADVKPR
jgi:hypothetical protein